MIVIKNGTLVNLEKNCLEKKDIFIQDGKIASMEEQIGDKAGCQVIDARGLMIAPGLVDVHVHFRDPGFTYKEDLDTGAAAAKRGGFTTVIMMANTKPAVDNPETLQYLLREGEKTGIHVLPCACVSKNMEGKELTDMERLKSEGAVGFTDDGIPLMDKKIVMEAMERAKKLGVPISFHEEDKDFIEVSGINQGEVSKQLGVGGASALAEDILVARDGLLSMYTGCKINIQHISSKNAVELVRFYKKLGAPIYAEATPHHFSLNEQAVLEHGTLAKMNPPLRTREDQEAIIEGLKDGTIDFIATDHAPHTVEEKERPFEKAPSGIIGLETSLALGITNLVKKGHLNLLELIQKMTKNPLELYGLHGGVIKEGAEADLVLFNMDEKWTVNEFASKAKNSPFIGQELYGKVHYTICSGKVVYQEEA